MARDYKKSIIPRLLTLKKSIKSLTLIVSKILNNLRKKLIESNPIHVMGCIFRLLCRHVNM